MGAAQWQGLGIIPDTTISPHSLLACAQSAAKREGFFLLKFVFVCFLGFFGLLNVWSLLGLGIVVFNSTEYFSYF